MGLKIVFEENWLLSGSWGRVVEAELVKSAVRSAYDRSADEEVLAKFRRDYFAADPKYIQIVPRKYDWYVLAEIKEDGENVRVTVLGLFSTAMSFYRMNEGKTLEITNARDRRA